MSLGDFKKVVRTVQLGFYSHDASDAIVDMPLPNFDDMAPSDMPSTATDDYLLHGPPVYPITGDKMMESLSRSVLSDLFWMCCCKGGSAAVIMPASRRAGESILKEKVMRRCYEVLGDRPFVQHHDVNHISELLGAPLSGADAHLLLQKCHGSIAQLCEILCEAKIGDCTVTRLIDLGNRFARRCSRAYYFLIKGGKLSGKHCDTLTQRFCDFCSHLLELAVPGSNTLCFVNQWVRELLTGVPSLPLVQQHNAPQHQPLVSFGTQRLELEDETSEERMLRDAISSPRSANSTVLQTQRTLLHVTNTPRQMPSPRHLRLLKCSPTIASVLDTSEIKAGDRSQKIHLTSPWTPRSRISNSEFAKLSSKIYLQPVAPTTPLRHTHIVLGDKQGRRDLMQLAKTMKTTKDLTVTMVQRLRDDMRDLLTSMESAKFINDPKLLVQALVELKNRFDEVYADSHIMINLSSADRRDLLERIVFIAKLKGEKERQASELEKARACWNVYTTTDL